MNSLKDSVQVMEKSVGAAKAALAHKALGRASYDERKHPRNPKGTKGGGKFAPKGGGGTASARGAKPLSRDNLLRVYHGRGKTAYVDYRHFINNRANLPVYDKNGNALGKTIPHADITDYDPNF